MDRLVAARIPHGDITSRSRRTTVTGALLEVESLVKRYGDTVAVDGVSFSVHPGEIFGLLGPNGAGKTTVISIVSTLRSPDGGTVHIGGHNVAADPSRARGYLGLVPQELGLFPVMSVRENLEYFAGISGVGRHRLKSSISDALDFADLRAVADKPRTRFLSGGMLRRLNLAAGLVHKPRLLLLDEPTVGVDAQSRNLILDNVRGLAAEQGIAVVYTTHYMEEAEKLCDRVAIIDQGRILVCDEVKRLVASSAGTTIETTLATPSDTFAPTLRAAAGITSVTLHDELRYAVQCEDEERGLAALVGVAGGEGVAFERLRVLRPSLEQVFLQLTGKELRDEEQR